MNSYLSHSLIYTFISKIIIHEILLLLGFVTYFCGHYFCVLCSVQALINESTSARERQLHSSVFNFSKGNSDVHPSFGSRRQRLSLINMLTFLSVIILVHFLEFSIFEG